MKQHNQKKLTLADIKRRRERGERIPADVEATLARVAGQITRMFRDFDAWVRSGDPRADWALVIWPYVPETDRLAACHRIVERMHGHPIYPERWATNAASLLLALENRKTTQPKLAALHTWEAVFDTVGEWTRAEVMADDKATTRTVREALQKLICEDLLGPGWRRHWPREKALSAEVLATLKHDDPAYECFIASATVDALVEAAHLKPTQQETLEVLLMTGGDDGPATAKTLGIKLGTWRQRECRLLAALRGG